MRCGGRRGKVEEHKSVRDKIEERMSLRYKIMSGGKKEGTERGRKEARENEI